MGPTTIPPTHNNHQISQKTDARHGRTKEEGSLGSENSTVSELFRNIIPLNQISAYFPNAASNLFGSSNSGNKNSHLPPRGPQGVVAQRSPSTGISRSQDQDLDLMLFDAVPFNGDTDNEGTDYNANDNSPIRGSGPPPRIVDFRNMDIHVPMQRGFGSNISPIGNVSSRGLHADADDESDDDLDRILGKIDDGDGDGDPRNLPATKAAEAATPIPITGTSAFRRRLAKANAATAIFSTTQKKIRQQDQEQHHHRTEGDSGQLYLDRTLSTERSLLDETPPEVLKSSLATQLAVAPATNQLLLDDEEVDEGTASSTMVAPQSWPLERSLQLQQRIYGRNNVDEYSIQSSSNRSHWGTKLRTRFHKRTFWLIALVVCLSLVLAIMLGTMFAGNNKKNGEVFGNQVVSAATDETNNSNNEKGIVLDDHNGSTASVGVDGLPTARPTNQPPLFLRPSESAELNPSQPLSPATANDSNLLATSGPTSILESRQELPSNPTLRPSAFYEYRQEQTDPVNSNDFDFGDGSSGSTSAQRLKQVRLDMGPIVGHTTHDSVTIWAYYQKPAIYESKEDEYALEILLYDADGWIRTINEARPDGNRNYAVFITLTDLEALTMYRYEMRILGKIVGSGSFRTAPPSFLNQRRNTRRRLQYQHHLEPQGDSDGIDYTGSTFEYVLASSMDLSDYPVQKAWEAIPTIRSDGMKVYPDFVLLAGDTIYLDEDTDFDTINRAVRFDRYWQRSMDQRNEPRFSDFVANTPVYAVWNIHDYGAQSATKDQSGKEESLRAWNALWPNPMSSGNSNQYNGQNYYEIHKVDGIYYSFYWGDVHYIVTDDRWNRDPYRETRWGIEQTNWIRSELVSSSGTFKIIVLGSDVTERGWSTDLESIGSTIRDHSINGVVFHTGDIHRNEYKRVETEDFPYPVTVVTSSGIAKVWRKPFVKISVDTTLDDPTMTARFFGATSMEEVDPTWSNDPSLVCSSIEGIDRDKEHSCTETIRLSDLTVVATP